MDTELERILFTAEDKEFPPVSQERGEVTYIEKYKSIRIALQPIHASVEKSALANSLKQYIEDIRTNKESDDAETIIKNIPVIYLNNHGHGHVERVMDRVSDALLGKVFEVIGHAR